MPRFYLDLREALRRDGTGETPWTPAIAVAFQVDEGIGSWRRRAWPACSRATSRARPQPRSGLQALGFELLAEPAHRSGTVTAAWVPEGLDWKAFSAEIKRQQLVLAGGQGKLTGKVFRLGHLGSVTLEEIVEAIETIETVSIEWGREVERGAAVDAAQRAAADAALQPA